MNNPTFEYLARPSHKVLAWAIVGGVIFLAMSSQVLAQSLDPNDWADPNDWHFEDGFPGSWSGEGQCGTIGANGDIGLAPGGDNQYGYCVTEMNGPIVSDPFLHIQSEPGINSSGAIRTTPFFVARQGDRLRMQVNYITTDRGNLDADHAWVQFIEFTGDSIRLVGSVELSSWSPSDTVNLRIPSTAVSISPSPVPLQRSSQILGPIWQPLGSDSGACAGQFVNDCGFTGWVEIEVEFPEDGLYYMNISVFNMDPADSEGPFGEFQSGIAFDGIEFIPAEQPVTVLIEATAADGGSVEPSFQEVNEGESAVSTVTPAVGYERSDEVGGTCSDADNPGSWDGDDYTTPPVNASCTVEFSFEAIPTITVTVDVIGEGGNVEPSFQEVSLGESAVFTVTPAAGYERSDEVGGTCSDADNPGSWDGDAYTTPPVNASCTVEFSFEAIPTITVTADVIGVGGIVSPSVRMAFERQFVTFTVITEPDFFRSLVVEGSCPEGQWIGTNDYQTGDVVEDCDVQFRFDPISELLRLDLLNLGAVFGDGQSYVIFDVTNLASEDLGPILLSAELEPGYEFASWNSLLPSCRAEDNDEGGVEFKCDVSAIPMWICAFEGGFLECELAILPQTGTASLVGIVDGDGFSLEDHVQTSVGLITEKVIVPSLSLPLNDTGIDWCGDNDTNFLDCPVSGFPGQDGEHGRDALARQGELTKVGGGAAGFDFTKLDAEGNNLPADASSWSCVRDNHTGLIWEVKVNDPEHLRHKNHAYTWFNPDPDTNGGEAGVQDGASCSSSACNTHDFVHAVNAEGLCGANDWRMPTSLELHLLTHHGETNPAIDTDYFPETVSSAFWSASPYSGASGDAWRHFFINGGRLWDAKSASYPVMLVRGEVRASVSDSAIPEDECTNNAVPQTTPSSDFRVIGDGSVVRHESTGLEWQRCTLGQNWDGSTCIGSASSHTWQGAMDVASSEGENWRLPNFNELSSIVEHCRTLPALNRQVFPNGLSASASFWSASPSAENSTAARLVLFDRGLTAITNRANDHPHARLVRDAQ